MRAAEGSSLDGVVLVVGDPAEEALAGLTLRRAQVAYNEAHGEGCAASLLAGLDAAGDCDSIMLLLGDMPGVDADLIDLVRRTWERERSWMALTSYEDGLGHPFVFSADAFGSLRGLHGDKAVWKLVEQQPERVARIRAPRPLPRDVDTWDDYRRVRAAWAKPA